MRALSALMAGLVLVPSIAAGQSNERQVTFTKDVAPILQRSCVTCHRPGEMAPMSLMTYEDVRPWARAVKTRVAAREMPPWHIDRNIGIQQFKDDPSLTDEEIATIVEVGGRGCAARQHGRHAAAAPVRRQLASGRSASPTSSSSTRPTRCRRRVPTCSATSTPTSPSRRIATSRRFRRGRRHPRRARSCTTRCRTRSTIPRRSRSIWRRQPGVDGGQFLVEYASGKNAEVYPDDAGVLLQAGKKAMVSYHLHSIGEETKAEIELGIKLYPEGYVPKHIRWSKQLAQPTAALDIPAGTVARIDGYTVLHKPARIIAFQPHMHIRGKRQCLELIYPTSRFERADRGRQLRELQLQLAPHLQLRRRRRSRSCRPARSCTRSAGTTIRPRTRPTPIRRTGSATDSGRSTRWASRGSAGSS